jgi:hypothetical protein
MVRTKRKDRPIGPIDIEPQHKKIRQEKISTFHIKKRKKIMKLIEKPTIQKNMLANYFQPRHGVIYTRIYSTPKRVIH